MQKWLFGPDMRIVSACYLRIPRASQPFRLVSYPGAIPPRGLQLPEPHYQPTIRAFSHFEALASPAGPSVALALHHLLNAK